VSTELYRRGDCWYLATARAMALSLLAVVASVVVVCGIFVVLQADQLQQRDYVSVTQCLVSKDGQRAIALWWSVPTTLQGWSHRVTVHHPEVDQPGTPLSWPKIVPACVASSHVDDAIFVGAWDGSLYAVREPGPKATPHFVGRHNDGVLGLAASADGQFLVSLSPTAMCVWNLATNELQCQGSGGQVNSFCIHPDSRRLLCGMNDGTIIERDLLTGERIRSLLADAPPWPVHDLDVSNDGRTVSVVHSTGDVRLLSAEAASEPLPCPAPLCQVGWPRFARFSECGTMLVSCAEGDEPNMAVWSIADGQQLALLRGHTDIVLGAEFTADGRLFSWGQDATIRIWDVQRGQTLNVLSLSVPGEQPARLRKIPRPPFSARVSDESPPAQLRRI